MVGFFLTKNTNLFQPRSLDEGGPRLISDANLTSLSTVSIKLVRQRGDPKLIISSFHLTRISLNRSLKQIRHDAGDSDLV